MKNQELFCDFFNMAEFRGGGGGWKGFGDYMRDKTRKLMDQYDERYATGDRHLFQGKTFWATGRMEGIDVDLKEVITTNGGIYEQYGFRSVSHVIASNVALSNQNWKKILSGRRSYKSYYLVTPQWILDSIEAGKCLRESDYLPECIRQSGTLDVFLHGSVATHTSQGEDLSLDDMNSASTSSGTGSSNLCKRVLRADIYEPYDTSTVVDEFCLEFFNLKSPLLRKAFVTIHHSDFINVFGLSPELLRLSLAEALLAQLQCHEWVGVSRVSLSVYEGPDPGRELRILPLDADPPPSVFNNHILNLTNKLRGADEDNVSQVVESVLAHGSTAINAIFIDTLNHHISTNRGDLARILLMELGFIIDKTEPNIEMKEWYHEIYKTAQDIFKWYNNGMCLQV